jgi:hypothetical protein
MIDLRSHFSFKPGFRMKCDRCGLWSWAHSSWWNHVKDGINFPYRHIDNSCTGKFQIQYPTSVPGVLTTWDDQEIL